MAVRSECVIIPIPDRSAVPTMAEVMCYLIEHLPAEQVFGEMRFAIPAGYFPWHGIPAFFGGRPFTR